MYKTKRMKVFKKKNFKKYAVHEKTYGRKTSPALAYAIFLLDQESLEPKSICLAPILTSQACP